MRFSLSRKILLIFIILISFSLVEGLILIISLNRFHSLNDDIQQIREFQLVIHTLEAEEIRGSVMDKGPEGNFDASYRRARQLLAQMAPMAERLSAQQQRHLQEAGEYLNNFRQAAHEQNALFGRASILRRQLVSLIIVIEQDISTEPYQNKDSLFPLLLELNTTMDEVVGHHEVALFPKMKQLVGKIIDLSPPGTLSAPLDQLLDLANRSYLNSLEMQERASFLQNTAAHFYQFSDAILASLTQDIRRTQNRLNWLMRGIFATAALVCTVLFVASRRYFRNFLHHQREAISAIENNRFDYPLPPDLPRDELGDLARFTKEMALKMQHAADEVNRSHMLLAASAEHVRLLLNSAAEAIYGLDSTARCTFCNRSMLDLLGFEHEEELLGKNIHDIIHHHHPDNTPYLWEDCFAYRSFLQGREIHSDEEVFFRKDGSSFAAECWSHPIVNNGEITGAVVTFIDITKRREAEQALRNSEQLYRTLIEQIDLGVTMIDKEYNIVLTNSAQGRLFNKAPQLFRGEKCFREFEKRAATCEHCPGTRAMASRTPQEALATGVLDDGSTTSVRIRAFPVFAENNEVTGFIEVIEDVSRKLKAERDLAAERERLAVTLRSIGDGVIATDTAGRIVLINKVAEQLCGWAMDEAVGRPLTEVFRIVNEKTGAPCENPVDKALATGMIVNLANHTVLIARDGSRHSIADSGAPIRNDESKIIGMVLVFRDVTEKQQMEEQIFKSRKLESIGVLAGGIAHDFNNILGAILGNINLVRHIIAPTETRAHTFLEEAEKASIRAQNLTQQLLTFAKGGEPVRKAASLTDIIKDSTEFILRGSEIIVNFDLPADLRPVDVDPGQISQVIQNLVLNARHAMPVGGKLALTCRNVGPGEGRSPLLRPEKRYVRVDIADTGIGIPATIVDRIFDPYFTTKSEGSGLGLAICHSIIDRHQGAISVQSEPGKGTSFTIYLPAAEATMVQNAHVAHSEKALAPLAMTVLLMDDDEQIRIVATAMLNHLGCEVLQASNGEEALATYRSCLKSGRRIAVVVMDLTIPGGMGGKEAVTRLLEIDPAARVIVSSGYSSDPVMANFQDYGFCGAIVKPYQLKELARVIGEAVAERGEQR